MRGERDMAARARVLGALRAGENVLAAAKAAGVGRQTVYQWVKRGDEELGEAIRASSGVRRAKKGGAAPPPAQSADAAPPPQGLTDEDVMRLRKLGLAKLAEILRNDEQPAAARVAAAKALVEHGERWAARVQVTQVAPRVVEDRGGAVATPEEVVAKFRVVGQRRQA